TLCCSSSQLVFASVLSSLVTSAHTRATLTLAVGSGVGARPIDLFEATSAVASPAPVHEAPNEPWRLKERLQGHRSRHASVGPTSYEVYGAIHHSFVAYRKTTEQCLCLAGQSVSVTVRARTSSRGSRLQTGNSRSMDRR